MIKKNQIRGFTILELLVVLAVIGVFAGIAYPNISNWITDRNVKKEVYETVAFVHGCGKFLNVNTELLKYVNKVNNQNYLRTFFRLLLNYLFLCF